MKAGGVNQPLDVPVLLNRCRAGDALAWEALVRRYQARIYGLAFYYLRDPEEARDCAQEIFVRIYQGLDSCADDRTFTPWMLTMGRNCCIDRLRRQAKRPLSTDELNPWERSPRDEGPNPEETLAADTRRRLIYRALEKLSLQSREIIVLKEIQGLKFREIATMLGLPIGTVKSRSGRARIELAKAVVALDSSYGARS